MNESSIPLGRMAIVAICSAIAFVCLLVLAPDPDGANYRSQSHLPLTSKGDISQDSRAAFPFARNTVPKSRGIEVPRSDFTTPQRDDPPDPGIATVGESIWLTQQHNSTFDRQEAISALGDSRDPMAELTLVNLLYDHDPAIRETAVESLASHGTLGAIQGLGFALTDTDPLIRRTAVELLADIGTPEALEALSITLIDPDVDLRLAAVYELADNESEAASALLQEFLSDANPSVRNVAAEFLNH